MRSFVLAYATTHETWADRLAAAAATRGWQLLSATNPESLLALLVRSKNGLIVADWEAVDTAPGLARRWVAKARMAAPGFSLLLAGGPDCFGSSLSRMLAVGADDVLERVLAPKDLTQKLLIYARRRCWPSQEGVFLETPGGELRVNRAQAKLFLKERGRWKIAGPLSRKELILLCCFLENPGGVLSRPMLLELLRPGRAHDVNAEVVDKHVEALRRKLGRFGRLIATVYGAGYRLRSEPLLSASRGGDR